VSEARWPSLCSIPATRKPGLSVGTRKALIPFLPCAGSVIAKTIAICAFLPVVMNCLVPFSTQRLPWRRARVLIAAASDPACGSVRQKQASISPFAIGSRKRRFCSSDPYCKIGMHPTEFCTLRIVDTAPSPAAISSITSE
jgi:hypothetical protein